MSKLCQNGDAALQNAMASNLGQTLHQRSLQNSFLDIDSILCYGHGQKATQLQGAYIAQQDIYGTLLVSF